MSNKNDNLHELAQQFKIAQGLPTHEHIRILQKLEKVKREKLILILNYFMTLETNPEVLSYIIKLASRFRNDLTMDILIDLFLSKNISKNDEKYIQLKITIANALGNSKNNDAVLPLLYVLNSKDEHYKVRLACAEALGKIGSSYAVTPLINLVSDDEEKSMYLRESAAKALGMLGDMRAVDPLVNILENKNGLFDKFTFLKERIIETLGRLGSNGDERSLKALKNALEDDASYIRCGAVEALVEIDDDRVIPLIENMLEDKDEEVARTAIFALYELLGCSYIKSLLTSTHLQECCKDEIQNIIKEEEAELLDSAGENE
ncbi:MAG: HEAT repeat domain-containing protein [Candidatus Gastranaerophilales bacterium]|nr:HEAT repeat domain-containing protein [Candidatus Gastranaerophilales bacterium]